MKEAYYVELSASKAATTTADSSKSFKPAEGKFKKPLVKKRVAEDDPFASDNETNSPKNGKLAGSGEKRKILESKGEGSGNQSPVKRKKIV